MPKIVDHEQQRRELSSTVASTLVQLGLENTTLRAVAANHGCTKGMVQHYFADKEELLLGALSSVEEQCEARLTRTGVKHKGLARLHARLSALLPTSPMVVDEWKVRFSFSARAVISQEIYDCLSRSNTRHQQAGMSCLRQAQKAGDLRPGLNLPNSYRCLVALVSGLSLSVVVGEEGLSSSTQRQILKTAIENLRH